MSDKCPINTIILVYQGHFKGHFVLEHRHGVYVRVYVIGFLTLLGH